MMRVIFILFALLSAATVFGQVTLSTRSKKAIELYTEADNYRVRGQFAQAIALLQEAIEKDAKFAEAYYRLGLVYFSQKKYAEAIAQFEKGLALTTDERKQKVYWFDLGESYLSLQQYDKAEEMLEKFLLAEVQNKAKIDRAKTLLSSVRFARANREEAGAFNARPLSDTVNRFALQYFPVLTADQQAMIFTRRLGNSGQDDEDLVITVRDARGQWTAPKSLSPNINSEWNEGTCTISADGRKLIFTSCLGRAGYGQCDLFQSLKTGNEWSVPENLGPQINTADWESQPSLSADGRTLYFVSDRRGGYGRRDIWVSSLNERNEWTKAVNAGKAINTVYDEISPFIHVNNRTLYFASNGLPGFGGYDIFFVERNGPASWTAPKNVGAPVNDFDDQFSLFITADGSKAYYVHEEAGKEGYSVSKIYEAIIPDAERISFKSNYVKGQVTDQSDGRPLKASVELVNLNSNEVESVVASDSITGEYLIVLTQGAEYGLYVSKKGYLFQSKHFNYAAVDDFEPVELDVALEPVKVGSGSVLNNIFFETDKFQLQDKSKTELQKVVRFLRDNPTVSIEISGHTDNVGGEAYNRQLSLKRAQSVYAYLVENDVDAGRLVTRGYGPDQPVGSNDTESGRQLNRRIAFKVIR